MKYFLTKLAFLTSFIMGAAQLSAQTISYDSIQDDGTRNDTLTFTEDFADAKYLLTSLFASNDSLSFQLNKINANGAISATVADDTLTISALKDGYGQASVEVTATNPTAGAIEVEIASGSQLEIGVSDLSGRIVQTKQVNRTGATIDIADEVAGIYLMTVKDLNSSEVKTFRIVKF